MNRISKFGVACLASAALVGATIAANANDGSDDRASSIVTMPSTATIIALNPQPLPPMCIPPGCKPKVRGTRI